MKAEDILTRSLRLLQGAIRGAGISQTEVDDRIGRRRGYLSHVFQRRVDLKVEDLLRTLEVLEVEPRKFFATATAEDRQGYSGLLQMLHERSEGEAEKSERPAEQALVELELEERVRRVLQDLLAQLETRSGTSKP